ncbi:MAG TPA: hypothetical protein EYH36_01115 [Desulfocapsa sulfexigens]|nr:hypothetical protein [Desulfocapsa sulfexigens]
MKNALLAIASVALLFGGMFARSWYKNRQADKSSFLGKENISTFIRDHSQTLGSDDAKVYIVEFRDPACEPFPEVDTRWKPTVSSFSSRLLTILSSECARRHHVLNGRPLQEFGYRKLHELVQSELQAACKK